MNSIVISSGHGLYVRGASGYCDEVNEARRIVDRVTEMLKSANVQVTKFHDNTSHSQSENLSTITNFHNAQPSHTYDVSVHLNAYSSTTKPMGVEVLWVTQEDFADRMSEAIAAAGHFIDRGPKYKSDLAFLNNTRAKSILIETMFCDSRADTDLLNQHFEDICRAIAETLAGVSIDEQPPDEIEMPPPSSGPIVGEVMNVPYHDYLNIRATASSSSPIIGRAENGDLVTIVGSSGDWYKLKWGDDHMAGVAVYGWASSAYIDPQGEVPGGGALSPLSDEQVDAISVIAINSRIANYNWDDRGIAPDGYVTGFALAFANTYRQLLAGYSPAVEMAKKNSGNSEKDVLQWYYTQYRDAEMDNTRDGPDTLRHLWALLMGLGMRESSGQHCCGRDQSADNTSSDTAEAGLFQTSYNAHTCSSEFDELMRAFGAGELQGFLAQFEDGVSCSSSDWDSYGSGMGKEFQDLCKSEPAFACETCAVVLRKLRQHYGPINREEAELKTDADVMLHQVQDYIDTQGAIA
jgi:hypothetical protein